VLHGGDPSTLYLAVVTASAALGILALTPIAIVLALTPGPRLKALLDNKMDVVRQAMAWTVVANLLAVAIGIVGIASDEVMHAHLWMRVVATGAEFVSLMAMARLVWFFVALLRLSHVDQTEPKSTFAENDKIVSP
jgi:outer membrane protease